MEPGLPGLHGEPAAGAVLAWSPLLGPPVAREPSAQQGRCRGPWRLPAVNPCPLLSAQEATSVTGASRMPYAGDVGLIPGLGRKWRRKWQPTPVFLPGESQGQRSLVGCRLWGRTESDATEATWQQQQQYSLSMIWRANLISFFFSFLCLSSCFCNK